MLAIRTKRLIVFIFLTIVLLGSLSLFIFKIVKSYQAKNQKIVQGDGEIKIVTREKASDVARSFLEKQDYEKDYDINSARVENFVDFWNVWFDKKDKNSKPNKGLIQVDKKTAEAIWKELQ